MAVVKFERSRTNRMLAGVCGALADRLHIDATIVRLVVVVGTFLTGGALGVAYAIAWLILPLQGSDEIGLDKVVDYYLAHRNRQTPPQA